MNFCWLLKRTGIIFALLLLIAFPLNKQFNRPGFQIPPQQEKEISDISGPAPEIPELTEKISSSRHQIAKQRPSSGMIKPQHPEKPETLPARITPIDLPEEKPDPDVISIEMKELAVENKNKLQIIKRLYIPKVEYHSDIKNYILPAGLIAVGAIFSQTEDYRDIIHLDRPDGRHTVTSIDDIMEYAIAPSVFIFDIFGKEKHDPVDQFFLLILASGITALEVRPLKEYFRTERPDGGIYSFPSGHTASAFMGAHMIYKEFRDSNSWIAYSGYVLAGTVGALRVVNNRHWVCDIIAGAGMGILGTELAYLAYFPLRNLVAGEFNKLFGKYFIVTPVIQPEALGLQVNLSF